CITEGGKIRVSGYTEIYLLYLSSDESSPVYSYKTNVDFSVAFDSPGCTITPVASCKLLNVSYTINSENSVEVRGTLDVGVECIRTMETDIIYSVENVEYVPTTRPSIIVSCVCGGRTLWDIAKEYLVSPEDILAANALEKRI
ncbi:MAG: LysM peptidoglycan-binding domain-containing protein, partial [Clostridia bacterium]|nr:LysM peptidoglycan-binding domain-containing protein [Clostridia bacterium]